MVIMKLNGLPIPLYSITPNLLFYPFKFPSNVVLVLSNRNNINKTNEKHSISLNKQEHLFFIENLMKCLNISYMIVNDMLIDLDRKDFEIHITDDNNVYISDYGFDTVTYINEKCFENKIKNLNLMYEIKNNNNNNNNENLIINHCIRISKNTEMIKKAIDTLRCYSSS